MWDVAYLHARLGRVPATENTQGTQTMSVRTPLPVNTLAHASINESINQCVDCSLGRLLLGKWRTYAPVEVFDVSCDVWLPCEALAVVHLP
jgi:hypothetical protein